MPESIKNIILLLASCIIAVMLGQMIAVGQIHLVAAFLLVVLVATLALHKRTSLVALAIGMSWYTNENIFVRMPYVTLVLTAVILATFLRVFVLQRPTRTVLLTVSSHKIGILLLFVMGGILVVATFVRYVGLVPEFIYGRPGGLRHSVNVLTLMLFTVMVLRGFIEGKAFRLIPWFALGVAIFSAILDVVNYINPQTYMYTRFLVSTANHEVISALTGAADSVFRIAALRELGFFFAAALLCWFVDQKNKGGGRIISFPVLLGLGLAAALVLLSGYRGYAIRFMILCLVVFWCYDRKLAWLSLVGILGVWVGVVALGASINVLPLQIQRVIGVFPGAFRTATTIGAMHGVEWRADLFSRFFRYQFGKHPWFGRGVIGELDLSQYEFLRDPIRFFERSQLYHSGVASCLDVVGIVGMACLVVAQLIALRCCVKLLRTYRDQLNGWMCWSVVYFLSSMPLFWYSGFFAPQIPLLWLSILAVYISYDHALRGQQDA